MRKSLYAVGIGYIGLCGWAVAKSHSPGDAPTAEAPPATVPVRPAVHAEAEAPEATPNGWFARVKPFCNVVEVETALRQNPAPPGLEGVGYQAACLALAGKIERARTLIDGIPAEKRYRAAGIVFEVAHPVADAGDDKSAGPIMAMVVDFWPNHYMALYHAGMSEFALGDRDRARRHLEAFLQNYSVEDGWRGSARAALAKLTP